jgi:NitT/TauT family transport system permease protein
MPRNWAPLAIRTGFVLLVVLLWDFSVRFGWIDSLFLASPMATADKFPATTRTALPHLYATLTTFAVAFVSGVLLAGAFGFAITLSGYAYKVFMPLLVLGVTIPKVTLLPLFVLWFGIEKTTIIVYGALSAFFPMIVNVMAASLEVKPSQLVLARAMGCGKVQTFTKVIFPAMLPVLSSGCFYACNAALMGVFIVELALSRFGMGALVHDLAVTFRTPELYAAVLLTAGITVAINMALWYTARHFGKWRGRDGLNDRRER